MIKLKDILDEGKHDPGVCKAIFLAGGPGSGKSSAAKIIFGIPDNFNISIQGLKLVNSDKAFEMFLDKDKLSKDLSSYSKDEFDKLTAGPDSPREKAKRLTTSAFKGYIDGRLGLIIDGTGATYDKIETMKLSLEEIGYDCFMVIVNTNLQNAIARNKKRSRIIPDDLLKSKWQAVQDNLGRFQSLFGRSKCVIIDNNQLELKIDSRILSIINKFITSPVKNIIGRKWLGI